MVIASERSDRRCRRGQQSTTPQRFEPRAEVFIDQASACKGAVADRPRHTSNRALAGCDRSARSGFADASPGRSGAPTDLHR